MVEVGENKRDLMPVRVFKGALTGVKKALGSLATQEFWLKLLATVAKEMVSAFLKALGGKLLQHGLSREDSDLKKTAQTMASQGASSAFSSPSSSSGYSSDFSRRSDYRSYPPAVVHNQPSNVGGNFPGF